MDTNFQQQKKWQPEGKKSDGSDGSWRSIGFGGSFVSDWLDWSGRPSRSCEYCGSGWDGGPGGSRNIVFDDPKEFDDPQVSDNLEVISNE